MLTPLSWVKELVDVKIPFPQLAQRLSEVGLTIEEWKEVDGDIIFDSEITPNRPDWMSIMGVAREIAAVTGEKLTLPKNISVPNTKSTLELKYKDDPKLCPRTSRILIKNVKVKSSPEWLLKRIKQIGLRPINNLVDITNYVLWLYGNPLHVFDYDKIRGHSMVTELSKGGEEFRSLDGIDYKLPKNAIVIKDLGRVIDLLPLKGGENTAVSSETKNILLHSIVCDPVLTRRTSQALGLRSDSSAVSERGVDPNGTTKAALKALELILDLAGGEVASPLIEVPEKPLPTWTVDLNHERLEAVLGIKVDPKRVVSILESLDLKVSGNYKVTIPTFRNDIHIEEDLIEEVGRMIGYNSFPKTLPASAVPTIPVAYAHNYDFDYSVKQTLKGAGYSEIYTYSLISEEQLVRLGYDPSKVLRIDNPISREYEFLRPTLFGNLLDAVKVNQANFSKYKLYEFGKCYQGETIDRASEPYLIWAAIYGNNFLAAKGDLEHLLKSINAEVTIRPAVKSDNHFWMHPGRCAHIETEKKEYLGVLGEVSPTLLAKWGIKDRLVVWSLNISLLTKYLGPEKKYSPIPKYPAITEDITLNLPENVLIGDVAKTIWEVSSLIANIELLSSHENGKTFRITYQNKDRNLTDKDVAEIRVKVLKNLKEKLKVGSNPD